MAVRFKIGVFDGDNFCIVPYGSYDAQLHTLFQGFPEKKWVRDRRGWKVPATTPNITYLHNTWAPEEYELTEQAKLLFRYEEVVNKVDERRSVKRWEYLFEDKPTDFDCPYTKKPFQHQLVAVESMIGAESFGLLMEMGTGKTYCIALELNYYACMMASNEMIRAVIACPKSLRENWKRELLSGISDYHNICVEILNGDMKSLEQIYNLLNDSARIKIAIVSYDSVSTMLPQLKAFKPTYYVADESHYLKNPESKRSKSNLELSHESVMRRILTGTPVSNNILDVWHQFEILRKGALGFQTYTGFKKEYAYVEKHGQFEKVEGFKDDKIEELKEHMARLSFVVKKERCLDLPERLYSVVTVEMPPTVREVYAKMAKEFYIMLEDGNEIKTEFIIVQMLKLSQICCGYAVGAKIKEGMEDDEDPEYERTLSLIPGGDAKMNDMVDDIEEVCKSSKAIVWSRFRLSNQMLKNKLRERGIIADVFDGGTKEADRQKIIDNFNTKDEHRVFIGNPQSGGVGLTLLGTKTAPCHTAYFYSNSFQFGAREQAEARNHRIGQVNKVIYKDYVYMDSIEEYIVDILSQKRDLADEVKNVSKLKEILLKAQANA